MSNKTWKQDTKASGYLIVYSVTGMETLQPKARKYIHNGQTVEVNSKKKQGTQGGKTLEIFTSSYPHPRNIDWHFNESHICIWHFNLKLYLTYVYLKVTFDIDIWRSYLTYTCITWNPGTWNPGTLWCLALPLRGHFDALMFDVWRFDVWPLPIYIRQHVVLLM